MARFGLEEEDGEREGEEEDELGGFVEVRWWLLTPFFFFAVLMITLLGRRNLIRVEERKMEENGLRGEARHNCKAIHKL